MNWQEMIQMRALKEELATSPIDLSIGCDYYQLAIEMALYELTTLERQIIFLRFWEALPIARVADRMGMSWNGADYFIDSTVEKIRTSIKKFKADRNLRICP